MKHDPMPAFGRSTLSFRSKPRGRMRALIALTVLLAAIVLGALAWIRSNQPIEAAATVAAKPQAPQAAQPAEPKMVTEPVAPPKAAAQPSAPRTQ
jgi:uncharacterized membrane protein